MAVFGWWGPDQPGAGPFRVRLLGLEPGARYLDRGTGRQHWGAELMQEGLLLPADAGLAFGSALVRLARVVPLSDVVHGVSTAAAGPARIERAFAV